MLLLYLFSKYARFLIDHGYIYISVSPLFEQGGKFLREEEYDAERDGGAVYRGAAEVSAQIRRLRQMREL